MKKSFLLLTLLCGALSAWAHDAEVDGIFYDLNEADKTATVTFKGDSYDAYDDEYAGDVVIPKAVTYNGITYSVTSLGDNCFFNCSSLTSVTIPNSVTSLGVDCFEDCSRLERVVVDAANPVYDSRENCNAIIHTATNNLVAGCKNSKIPNSVTSLGDRCFYECRNLTSITIPNSVTSLGYACFNGCSSLTSITIPNSVTSLGGSCFEGCSSLTSIKIPNSVTSLGYACFDGCSSLSSITIPNSVTSLGVGCFSSCSSLERIVVDATNPVYDSRENCNAIIHTSTNEIVGGCKNSKIPNSVTSLGDHCFYGCSSLTSITIPKSVTSVGVAYFSGCSSLERIVVDAANPVYDSRENCNAIIHTATNKLVAGCMNSKIPNSVTRLEDCCFTGCSSLTSITIPNSVTSLGVDCFKGCNSLTSITLPNSVTCLGDWCFAGCSSLASITIPNSVMSLGDWCFYGCSSLTSIAIPNSVTSLGDACFWVCSSLTSITLPNSVTSLGTLCFSRCSSLTSIYMLPSTPPSTEYGIFDNTPLETVYVVDENAKKAYQAKNPWNKYKIVVKPTGIK